jgi:hypothetical protein
MTYAFKSIALRRATTRDSAEYRALEGLSDPLIRREDLLDNHVYEVNARNFCLGVWSPGENGFWGVRYKFGNRFMACEYLARECGGKPDGYDTATPCLLVGPVPPSVVWSASARETLVPLEDYLMGLQS